MGFTQASSVVGGATAASPSFAFYRDSYDGSLAATSFSDAMPAALRCVRELCGRAADDGLETADLEAWTRACCAATEAFAEFGEGRAALAFEGRSSHLASWRERWA